MVALKLAVTASRVHFRILIDLNQDRMSNRLWLLKVIIMFCCVVVISSKMIEDRPCPNYICKCYSGSKKAICTYKRPNQKLHATYIPKFPQYITQVKMTDNRITNITTHSLKNLTYSNIKTLLLTDNKINYIESDAFQQLRFLSYLEINRNVFLPAENLSFVFCSLNNTLFYKLRLMYNKWTDIPSGMFECLFGGNLRILSLKGNELHTIDRRTFIGLTELKELDLSFNKIVEYDVSWSYSLRKLNLRNNLLLYVPKFCSDNGSFIPRLRSLYLDNNRIMDISKTTFGCLQNLLKLSLNGNSLRNLKNNTFSQLYSLETLYLKNFGSQLKIIEMFAFNCSRLRKLTFAGNNFQFDDKRRYSSKYLFASCPNLVSLELTNNYLPSNSWILRELFLPLKRIEKLILQATTLKMLPGDLFPNLPALHTLHLSGNYIHGWHDSPYVFGNSTSIRYLNLEGNNLDLINKTSFPETMLHSLEKLNLATNPFSCSCKLLWFKNWMRNTTVTLINYPSRYKCSSPPDMAGILLKDFNASQELCQEGPEFINISNNATAVIIVLSVVGVTSLMIAGILYKCRWHIRYWIYLLRYKKHAFSQSEKNFAYHGFVVYSEQDRKWVHERLLTKIEKEEGLQLCIHFRDFEIGKLIVDNIVESIEQSRKIILILSNDFAKSEWCQFELRLVMDRILSEASDSIVLVMLEEINRRHLSSSLRTLITSTTYATWTNDRQGQKQLWNQVTTALKRY